MIYLFNYHDPKSRYYNIFVYNGKDIYCIIIGRVNTIYRIWKDKNGEVDCVSIIFNHIKQIIEEYPTASYLFTDIKYDPLRNPNEYISSQEFGNILKISQHILDNMELVNREYNLQMILSD